MDDGNMMIKAVMHEAEEGGYWASVPSLPGIYTQGETVEELTANLREAIELYLSDDTRVNTDIVGDAGQMLEIAV
jgi:predicted RNase H-like HicB family nuclease